VDGGGENYTDHGNDSEIDEDKNESGSENEDEDDDETRRYWEVMPGKKRPRSSCRYVVISSVLTYPLFTQPKNLGRNYLTCDLRRFFKKGVRALGGEKRSGEYCQLCL